jgi:hypothetical protein
VSAAVRTRNLEKDIRVEKSSSGSSILGSLGFQSSNVVTFSGDTSDDRDAVVDCFDESLDDIDLLLFGEESSLSGVTKDNEALDTFDRREPGTNSLNGLVIDRPILVEGSNLDDQQDN